MASARPPGGGGAPSHVLAKWAPVTISPDNIMTDDEHHLQELSITFARGTLGYEFVTRSVCSSRYTSHAGYEAYRHCEKPLVTL